MKVGDIVSYKPYPGLILQVLKVSNIFDSQYFKGKVVNSPVPHLRVETAFFLKSCAAPFLEELGIEDCM